MLDNKHKYVILDTETTGLGNREEIIQLGIIDLKENVHADTLIKPTKKKTITKGAEEIHGISINDLSDSRKFEQLWPAIFDVIRGKRLLIYNADFDIRLLNQTAKAAKIELPNSPARCIMLMYAEFLGMWNDYHGNYRWPKLYGGDHTAVGDCKATLEVIKEMAEAEIQIVPKAWWEFWR